MLKLSGYSRLNWGRIGSATEATTHKGRKSAFRQRDAHAGERGLKKHRLSRRSPPRTLFWANRTWGHAREANFHPARTKVWGGNDARHPGRCAFGRTTLGTTCVQKLDDSRDSAIHTKYRISLRSSSMQDSRYSLPKVVLNNS